MDNRTASGDKQHATPSHFDIFKGPPRHVARVTKALQAYMEKVEGMKNANAHLLNTMVDMCPKTWKILPELKIYLEDQSMLWSLAVSSLRPLFKALSNYQATTQGAKDALLEFEVRLNQVKTMSAEYELIKKSSRVSKVQQFQVEYMLRESGRALVNTRKLVEEKMLKFRRLQTELGKELLGTFEDVMKVTCSEGCQVSDLIKNTLRASPVKKTNKNGQPVDDLNFVQKQVQVVVDKVGSTPVDVSSKRRLNTPEKAKAISQASSQLEPQGKAHTKVVLAPTQPKAQAHPQTEPITRYETREQDRPVSASQHYQFRNEARRQSLENYTEFNRTACPFHCVVTQEQVKMTRVSRPKTTTPDANSIPRNSSEYNARQEYGYNDQGGVRAVTYTTTRAKTRYATPSSGKEVSGRHSRSSNADADDYACYLDNCGIMSPRPPTPGRQRNNNGNTDEVALAEEQRRGTKRSSEQHRQTRFTQTTAQTQGRSGQRKSGLPFKTSIPDCSSKDNVFFDCR
ncbi:uncharacterized protein [Haliotis cracherodii]|uniref:uncharacterized protein n=1 Tax=Haliotis cracherodii TaxID=6455 RepID=UPI0039ED5173